LSFFPKQLAAPRAWQAIDAAESRGGSDHGWFIAKPLVSRRAVTQQTRSRRTGAGNEDLSAALKNFQGSWGSESMGGKNCHAWDGWEAADFSRWDASAKKGSTGYFPRFWHAKCLFLGSACGFVAGPAAAFALQNVS
jgi:hypothetical protein